MTPSTLRAGLAAAAEVLDQAGVPTPEVDARWLLCHVAGLTPSQLALRAEEPLDAVVWSAMEPLLARRAGREPLQLILGTVPFRTVDLVVRPGVFIPRPETELLAGLALERLPGAGLVIEPCTGTGAVAISIAAEGSPRAVVATDRSPAAVALAAHNARRAGAEVTVSVGDLLAPVDPELRGRVDVIVSNPPYLAASDLAGTEPEVRDWDPVEALVSGPSGHETSDRLILQGLAWLRPGGWLLMELAETRVGEAAERAAAAGYAQAVVVEDLSDRARFLVARSSF